VVECGGLENRCSVSTEPGVRIPLSPQSLNNPANGGVVYFTEALLKACFHKELRENKHKPRSGYLSFAGTTSGITTEQREVVIHGKMYYPPPAPLC
jgi:hypothetical protein